MKIFPSKNFFLIIFLLGSIVSTGQKKSTVKEKYQPYHRITVGLLNANVPKSVDQNGNTKWMLAGGWGLDYYYQFHRFLSLGLQLDMIIQDLKIKEKSEPNTPDNIIERSYPLSICPVISYKPLKHLNLQFGNGTEYCSQGPLFVSTFSVEYERDLNDNFGVGVAFTYSIKWNVYDTYMISFVISKKLSKKKKS